MAQFLLADVQTGLGAFPRRLAALLKGRVLSYFLAAVFPFHLANAAMLPQLGDLLAKDNLKKAAIFMSACVIVTQFVIAVSAYVGRLAATKGRKPLLLSASASSRFEAFSTRSLTPPRLSSPFKSSTASPIASSLSASSLSKIPRKAQDVSISPPTLLPPPLELERLSAMPSATPCDSILWFSHLVPGSRQCCGLSFAVVLF